MSDDFDPFSSARALGLTVGTAGAWSLVVPPLRTRAIDLHIMKTWQHTGPGPARYTQDEVLPFAFTTPREGDWAPEGPAFRSAEMFAPGGHNAVFDFLQAAMNLAWQLGIRPAGATDGRAELAATRAHLEDMRRLVLHEAGAPELKPVQGERWPR